MKRLQDRRIDVDEHVARRRRLMAAMPVNSVALVPASRVQTRNRDTEFGFRQNSDFFYLTGFDEPDGLLLLAPGHAEAEVVLFVNEKSPEAEVWTGIRAGVEGAVGTYRADAAFVLGEMNRVVLQYLDGAETLFYPFSAEASLDQHVQGWCAELERQGRRGARPPEAIRRLDTLLHDLRLHKTPVELDVMRQAGVISAAAHRRAMCFTAPGRYEYEVEAELLHEFRRHGCDTAYGSIVAGGANACILHYVSNNAPLQDGDLLLIDAGAELENYAADITRTFPVNGRFSGEQKALYEVVLDAQRAAIEVCRVGRTFHDPHAEAVRVLTQGLCDLGLLHGDVDALI